MLFHLLSPEVNSADVLIAYHSCSQFNASGGGSLAPPGAFDFFGGYTHMDSGILFGIHNSCVSTYLIPGMAAWDGYPAASTPILRRHDPITTPTSVTEGAVPVWHHFGGKVCGGPTARAAGTQLHSG